ncbi:MAG: hypothetical protein KGZ66_08765 [Selenomonadales bacterium]|nr:hypothetical protein [Selenomonadales bacterium]
MIVVNRVIKGVVLLLLLAGLVAGITVGLPMFRETFTSIAVAAVNLSPGMQIRDGMVAMRMWRRDEVPEGAVFSLEGIMGRYVSERVTKDQPISPRVLTDVTPPPPIPCLQSYVTPQGYIAFPFEVPTTDAARLFVGDRVDLTMVPIDRTRVPIVVKDPITLKVAWRVHYIDYADPMRERQGRVPVYLVMKHKELHDHLPSAWDGGATRMFKSDR